MKKKTTLESRERLPELANKCVEWAETNGVKKIAKYQIQAFLSRERIDLLEESVRNLHGMVSVALSSRKPEVIEKTFK
jgi:hypothetical protein